MSPMNIFARKLCAEERDLPDYPETFYSVVRYRCNFCLVCDPVDGGCGQKIYEIEKNRLKLVKQSKNDPKKLERIVNLKPSKKKSALNCPKC
jgi:hypothetical protein